MRPFAVLIGIVAGSSVSLAVGLTLTGVVLLFLPEHADRFTAERVPLAKAMALFTLMATISSASFYAELRARHWRFLSHTASAAVLALTIWTYWPR